MKQLGERDTGETVRDIMTPDPISVRQDELLAHAAHLMEEHEVSGLPVVDADGSLVGMLSLTDMMRARWTQESWQRWPAMLVGSVMVAPVVTAAPSMSVREAAALMTGRNVHRLVVVDDEQRRPIGVVSATDLVRLMAQETPDV